jgi:hypothetical protein
MNEPLDVDDSSFPQVVAEARYGVQSIPKFVVLRGGRVVFQRAG